MPSAVTWFDVRGRAWREGTAAVVDTRVRLTADQPSSGMPRLNGVVAGAFTDSHVHLQLVDVAELAGSTLGRVFDMGGNPEVLAGLRHNSGVLTRTRRVGADYGPILEDSPESCGGIGVEVGFAGAFLTPPGGYPSDRSWAPAGAVREVVDADAAERVVVEMKDAGATRIKVASNAAAGAVFSDEMFAAIVAIAANHSMPVIAHAEGPGEAQRSTRLGAQMLAHAPFSERLTDAELLAMSGSVSWVSTLAIHDGEAYDIAVDNVRRFHAMGGDVVYGTDMGNGPTPVDVNPREIAALREAGIDGDELLRSLAPVDPTSSTSRLLFFPGCATDTADPLLARLLTPADLEP